MNMLIACEESQRVCTAFREKGHRVFSCDIQEPSGGHPEWHIHGNIIPLLNGNCTFQTMAGDEVSINGQWDMIIAFVPCTKTSNAGARHLYKGGHLNLQRLYDGFCGKALFMTVWNAECPRIVIENPTPSKIFEYPKPSQTIQPYQFDDNGEHPYSKRTHLWIKGDVPLLVPTTPYRKAEATWCPSGSYSHIHNPIHRGIQGKDRAKIRSKTFQGIAKAMADQWG